MDEPFYSERELEITPAPAPLACPTCNGVVDVKSRHVAVTGRAVRIYCSVDCLQTRDIEPLMLDPEPTDEVRRPSAIPRVLGVSIGLGLLVMHLGDRWDAAPLPLAMAAAAPAAALPPPAPPIAPDLAAEEAARRVEAERAKEAALVADLMRDAWVHPIAGPDRQMPRNHTQAFGAERPGDRPAECLSGHCGADLGGGLWGEPVRAVHDGVVDRVNRGPNEERGGVYVRLAHRDGTVFTQYFHLAAVPRWIRPGTKVEAGELIGLLGDTGVKTSAPHLHFTISVRPAAGAPERYLDPEPLLSIWPLWIVDDRGRGPDRVSTDAPAGVPMRGKPRPRRPAAAETTPPPAAAPTVAPPSPSVPPPSAPPPTAAASPSTPPQ